MSETEIVIEFKHFRKYFFLAFLIIILAFELNVTFTSPIAFGDEGFHVALARWIGTNRIFPHDTPLLGSAIFHISFTRPVLWNFAEASFYMLFGSAEFAVKFATPLLAILTGLVIYIFGKELFSEYMA